MMFMGTQNSDQAALENKVILLCLRAGMTNTEAKDAINEWTKDGPAVSLTAHAWAIKLINQWRRSK